MINEGEYNSGPRGGANRGRHKDHTGGTGKARHRSQVTPFRTEITGRTHE
jgi:hypothetical protein